MKKFLPCLLGIALAASAHSVFAEDATVNVGVVVSATGPAASLGIAERNTVALLPRQIGSTKVNYTILDDATDATQAVRNMRKLISENNADVIIGTTATPGSLAMIDVAAEKKIPMISLAASASIVQPVEGARAWSFKTPQNDVLMATAVVQAMEKAGSGKIGFIGFSDAYGQNWLKELKNALQGKQIEIVATESYARPDTSVTGQVLKLLAAKPDAILIAGSGTAAALPQRELKQRGYKGQIYQTHGAGNSEFLKMCGSACEGLVLPAGPILVADQLPPANPMRATGLDYTQKYEAQYGKGSVSGFGGHMSDAGALVAAAIPKALAGGAKPGTEGFRQALRDALENTKDVVGVHGVFNMSAKDHSGLDERARVLLRVKNGQWEFAQDLN